MSPVQLRGEPGGVLLLCDHASAAVPPGVDLGVAPDLMARHIAVDIGAEPLTRALSAALHAPAVLGHVSRLVIDLHRPPDHPHLVPVESDGHVIAGNRGADVAGRLRTLHRPYHRAVAQAVREWRPTLIVAIHSFTRELETVPGVRPWHVGILYNRDARAARVMLELLRQADIPAGDNQPYSGRTLNTTLNRHGEANGIPSVSIEVRNDLIAEPEGVARWAALLGPMIVAIRNRLVENERSAQ
ncbi:N-formylglutamate amidohydrolase [Sphingomonas aracearum]|uniref:N-formylglutamate amidohydrolase n=1 Tax=Sphingomonas aracearum TaxID=2283317 RepID=A0A369W061_9SPHN|nr:N-formylglutamate amidohydrolase [Sphingomonas aracearum]